jgi:hypothetical protein
MAAPWAEVRIEKPVWGSQAFFMQLIRSCTLRATEDCGALRPFMACECLLLLPDKSRSGMGAEGPNSGNTNYSDISVETPAYHITIDFKTKNNDIQFRK